MGCVARSLESGWGCKAHARADFNHSSQYSGDGPTAFYSQGWLRPSFAILGSGLEGRSSFALAGVLRWHRGASTSLQTVSVVQGIGVGKFEKLWRDLFSSPSEWWDNRTEKSSPRFPDFKHKRTGLGLWLNDRRNPPWVGSEIASIVPGVSVFSVGRRLAAFNKAGQYEKTMDFLEKVHQDGTIADRVLCVHLLNACGALQRLNEGRRIHEQLIENGLDSNLYVGSSLVDMYAKCGSIDEARGVFDKLPARDVVTWTAMILGCTKCGQGLKALELSQQMQREGVEPDRITFVAMLNACASIAALEEGERIHQQIIQRGYLTDVYVGNSLVDMYTKCGRIDHAWSVFDKMPTRNVVTWTSMIIGCVNCSEGSKALELFQIMQREKVEPDCITFVGLLKACALVGALEEGRRIHQLIIRSGCENDVFVCNILVDMYAKCGSIDNAWAVFDKMPTRTVVTWNSIIFAFLKCGEGLKALDLFQQMHVVGVEPNSITFVGLVNACASIGALEEGRRIHQQIISSGYHTEAFVSNSLVDMYAKCGSMDDAWAVFDKMGTRDVVAWTAMILGCVKGGEERKALELFQKMHKERVEPNSITFSALLNACAGIGALEEGKSIHEQIILNGCETDVHVGSSLIDMYAKCGSIDNAWAVFYKMGTCDVVAWTVMILGCVRCGEGLKALELFWQMHRVGVQPDCVTFLALLNACASIAALEEGRRIHKQIIQSGFESDLDVGNCLVDMYAKCGSIDEARRVFNKMPTRNVVGWTTMIMGYAMHGLAKEAVTLFEEMSSSGSEMNEITFICLLSACSHGGLVKEGMEYFENMSSVYGVYPTQEHYTCMVDMLGRAGHLDDAEAVANKMPKPCVAPWMSLLGACRIHGNVKMGERAFKRVVELGPSHAAGYVLLSNLYAATGRYGSKGVIQEQRLRDSAMKLPGRSWIEVNNEAHSFLVNDSQHPQILQIHEELRRLSEAMKKAGYIPDTRFALHDIEEEKKIAHLGHHSEKLAIAFGLISTPAGAPLLIVKNLRVCGDCHTATKLIATMVGREITVRDGNRFHRFKDGHCSCGDFW